MNFLKGLKKLRIQSIKWEAQQPLFILYGSLGYTNSAFASDFQDSNDTYVEDGIIFQEVEDIYPDISVETPTPVFRASSIQVGGGIAKAYPIKGGAEINVELVSPTYKIYKSSLTYNFKVK
ncbi:hypothetical protein [Niallia sp. Man26]|uniref:hypothetical protein n=1 Tax=Niallia sp. Man26 TaxID=2912824 RepID=UPI001EDAD528|nr:hypothetical protein [Niallia sp. Man26]UPO90745.1 hypothetical protein L8T27_022155 [Niallia sp. Man26]